MQLRTKCFVVCTFTQMVQEEMILGKFRDYDVFLKLSQMFAKMVWANLLFLSIFMSYVKKNVICRPYVYVWCHLYNKLFLLRNKKGGVLN